MDPTQNAAFLAFAALAPILVSLLKQSGLSTQWNALIALAVYAIVGIAGALAQGEALSPQNAVPFIAASVVVGTAAYNLFWSKVGGDEEGNGSIDDRITNATSIVK